MTTPSDRRAPDLDRECHGPLADFATIASALHLRHDARLPPGAQLELVGSAGATAAAIVAVTTVGRLHREIFVFARAATTAAAVDAVVDVIDDVLAKCLGVDRPPLPLDWQGRPFAGALVFVRGELRDYAAEEAAAELLGETPLPRAIPPRLNSMCAPTTPACS